MSQDWAAPKEKKWKGKEREGKGRKGKKRKEKERKGKKKKKRKENNRKEKKERKRCAHTHIFTKTGMYKRAHKHTHTHTHTQVVIQAERKEIHLNFQIPKNIFLPLNGKSNEVKNFSKITFSGSSACRVVNSSWRFELSCWHFEDRAAQRKARSSWAARSWVIPQKTSLHNQCRGTWNFALVSARRK